MADEYGPEDDAHVRQIAPRVNPGAPVGNVAMAEKLLQGFLDTFKKQLAGDAVAAMKFQRVALTCLHQTPKLQNCTQLSFLLSLMQCAELGLMPGSTTGHAFIIPYGNIATLIPGYRGYAHCAYRSGLVAAIEATPVYDTDEFRYARGTSPFVHHVPAGDEGRLTHAYCVVWLKESDRPMFWVVDERQADKAKASSMAAKKGSGPWFDHPESMWMKTAFRRLAKWIPMSFEVRRLLDIDSRDEDRREAKQSMLSGKGFLDTVQAEEAAPTMKALPDRTAEPVGESLPRATRSKMAMKREAEPPPRVGEAAPEPPAAAENLEAEPAPDAPPAKPGEEMKLVSQIMDLHAALSEKGVKLTMPAAVEMMPLGDLRALARRLEAKLAAI